MTEPNEMDRAAARSWDDNLSLLVLSYLAEAFRDHRIAAEERVRAEHAKELAARMDIIQGDGRCIRTIATQRDEARARIEALTDALALRELDLDAVKDERDEWLHSLSQQCLLTEKHQTRAATLSADRDALAAKLEQQLKEFRVLDDARDDVIDDWRTTAENKQRVIEKLRTELTAANQDREDARKIIDAYQQQTEQPAPPRPFCVGDRVRCVDAKCATTLIEIALVEGSVYTIADVRGCDVVLQGRSLSWSASRFVHAEADLEAVAPKTNLSDVIAERNEAMRDETRLRTALENIRLATDQALRGAK